MPSGFKRLTAVVRLSVSIAATLVVPRLAHAATYEVCPSGCTYTTINAAISNAATVNGDTISVHAGTFTESVNVTKNLTIVGAGASSTIVQSNTTYGTGTGGSVIKIAAGVTATIKALTARHGANPNYGGGVDNQGTVTLDGLIIERNLASNGAGVGNRGTMTIRGSVVRNNVGASNGAGIYNAANLVLEDSTVTGNTGSGGGIVSNGTSAVTTIRGSLISANSTIGVYVFGGAVVQAVNSTFTGNSGSAFLVSNSTLRLSSCTVTGNFDDGNAGGVAATGTTNIVQLKNTILSGNLREGEPGDCSGRIESYGGLMIGTLSECQLSVYGDGDVFEQPAGLDYLRDNGGPTPTHALFDDSPAIDAGDCKDLDGNTVSVDQRGVARPQGASCDIGAFESNGSTPGDKFGCWDLNENGVCNLATEDKNADGNCTPQDCQGKDGLACWDLNGDRSCNTATEDLNKDGSCNLVDCRGSTGTAGAACWDLNTNNACDAAEAHQDGVCNVEDCQGAAGFSCWDLDRDYACDPAENKNGDGDCTPADCQGSNGAPGSPGAAGTACWDANNNGTCNLPSEDPSGDNQCTVLDCRGAAGTSGFSCWDLNQNHACDPSEDKTADVACSVADCRGVDGYTCWDVDTDYTCAPSEDTNKDDTCTVADCQGPEGPQGPTGVTCWDLNANQSCDPLSEDLNGDESCTLADCKGENGLDGFTCWDLNNNRICDPSEDENADTQCNVLDCRGQDGADGEDGEDGEDGQNGENGFSCWDTNQSGDCDPAEDLDGDDVCDPNDCAGSDGVSALTRVSDEPEGSHCAAGGVKIETGIDQDGDAALSDEEVTDTQYACNGVDGQSAVVAGGDDSGCSCRTVRSPGTTNASALWLLAAGAALRLARRQFRRSGSAASSGAG